MENQIVTEIEAVISNKELNWMILQFYGCRKLMIPYDYLEELVLFINDNVDQLEINDSFIPKIKNKKMKKDYCFHLLHPANTCMCYKEDHMAIGIYLNKETLLVVTNVIDFCKFILREAVKWNIQLPGMDKIGTSSKKSSMDTVSKLVKEKVKQFIRDEKRIIPPGLLN